MVNSMLGFALVFLRTLSQGSAISDLAFERVTSLNPDVPECYGSFAHISPVNLIMQHIFLAGLTIKKWRTRNCWKPYGLPSLTICFSTILYEFPKIFFCCFLGTHSFSYISFVLSFGDIICINEATQSFSLF